MTKKKRVQVIEPAEASDFSGGARHKLTPEDLAKLSAARRHALDVSAPREQVEAVALADGEVAPGEVVSAEFEIFVDARTLERAPLIAVPFRGYRLVDTLRPPSPDGMTLESLVVGNEDVLIDPIPLAVFSLISFIGEICLPTKAVGVRIVARIRNAGSVKQKFALRLKGRVIR